MIYDAKSQVAKKLDTIQNVNVSASIKQGLKSIPCIVYKEMDNKPRDPYKRFQDVVYSIDIFNTKSTSKIANDVDEKLSELGLNRTACTDMDDGELRHKHMKFKGTIDTKTELVYQ